MISSIEVSALEAFVILFGLVVQALGVGIAYQKLRARDQRLSEELARQRRVLVLGIRLFARRSGNLDRNWLDEQLVSVLAGE